MNIILVSERHGARADDHAGLAALDGVRSRCSPRSSSRSRCCSISSTLRWAAAVQHPWLQTIVLADQREEAQRTQEKVQGHLNAMAIRLGELQAQMMRLDGLGERLARVAGLEAAGAAVVPARRRPGPRRRRSRRCPPRDLSVDEFTALVDKLARDVEIAQRPARRARGAARADVGQPQVPAVAHADRRRLVLVELRLPDRSVQRADGVSRGHRLSRAEPGTPIVAAASGKVVVRGLASAVW